MAPADAQPETAVQLIALHKLSLSRENVRKTDPGLQAAAELKVSIAALGVLSNLVVQAIDATSDLYAVIAGGRRYKALVALAEEGQVPPDMPVPCRVVPAGASPTEISLAENVVRAAMHPADQVEAFAALADTGAAVSAIAARFGVAERTVEQRLRLGNVAPELIAAYRDDRIDLECLKAFAVTTDTARQLAVWAQVSEQGYRPSAWHIKRLLTEARVPGNAAVARFVGADAYEAAGGAIDRDLFADEHDSGVWFEDPRLLDELAQKRLQDIALPLAREWKWAEARLEVDWNTTARFGRVHAVPAEPTPDETAERDRLLTRQDELGNLDGEGWTDELVVEAEGIEQRLDRIQADIDARAVYADPDKAISGCIVTIDHAGEVQIIAGLVRPDDIPGKQDDANATADHDPAASAGNGQGVAAPRLTAPERGADPAAEARKQAGVGIGLADDMRAIRTAIVKARLATDFHAAFDLFVFQAARSVFTAGYRATALEIAVRETADRPHLRANDDSFGDHSPAEAILADRSHLRLDWLTAEDDGEAFALWAGLTFGVYRNPYRGYDDPDVNFHGRTFKAGLPGVECIAGGVWSVRADIRACPEFELVLPARKEPVVNDFLHRMRDEALLAVYRAIAACETAPRLSYERRVHYLLEPGWRADQAIQGLGRTHRTHQASAPLFRPVATDVKGERRFIATIARRLDSLGAITRGQRDSQTAMGGDDTALFRESDNLESDYAKAALRQFYRSLHRGRIEGWSTQRFQDATGLSLTHEGSLKEDLPPMPQFLNRLLALPIDEQNVLFAALEERIEANIASAIEAGTFNLGVETVRAESLTVAERETVFVHPATRAETEIVEILRRDRLEPLSPDDAIGLHRFHSGEEPELVVNARSRRAAIVLPAPVRILDNGDIQQRYRLMRPNDRETIDSRALAASHWEPTPEPAWRKLWNDEIAALPSHTESRFWLVAGLLLPIWDRLPDEDLRVRRLATDDGEQLIGRILLAEEVRAVRARFGLDGGPALSAEELHDQIMVHGRTVRLANGWKLARRRHMNAERLEIEGPTDRDIDALKRAGCVTEIVSWRTRVFAPGTDALQRVVRHWPVADAA